MEAMPPKPVPWVEATMDGCTAARISAGVKPADRYASTVVTMFHSAISSTSPTMEAGMPHLTGSKPFGNWPPTVRVIAARRGTRIIEPA